MTKNEFEELSIDEKLIVLFEMLKRLEDKTVLPIQLVTPVQPINPSPNTPYWPTEPLKPYCEGSCRVCGIKDVNRTHYVCNRTDCPSGFIYCQSNTGDKPS